jgi:L-2-hydroxyglutarate oxidase LhgO
MLYAYCSARGVAHRKLGKLIVATRQAQVDSLRSILARAQANGVENIAMIDAAEALRLEPQLACIAALHSRETGIVDSHGLMLALLGDLEAAGGALACASPFAAARRVGDRWIVRTGGEADFELAADAIVNAAGLHAQDVAAAIEPASPAPRRFLARGCYFQLAGRAPFSRLIYPVPVPGGLGVHLTLDLGGQARFGPDVEWIDAIDYTVDPHRADAFYAEVREYWPQLPDASLAPAYAGIRPKLSGPGEPAADFVIDGPRAHGVPGLIHLFGIESPGLTACLAIGEHVSSLLREAAAGNGPG